VASSIILANLFMLICGLTTPWLLPFLTGFVDNV